MKNDPMHVEMHKTTPKSTRINRVCIFTSLLNESNQYYLQAAQQSMHRDLKGFDMSIKDYTPIELFKFSEMSKIRDSSPDCNRIKRK